MSHPVASTVPVTVAGLTSCAVNGRPSCMNGVGVHGDAEACDTAPSAMVTTTAAVVARIRFFILLPLARMRPLRQAGTSSGPGTCGRRQSRTSHGVATGPGYLVAA